MAVPSVSGKPLSKISAPAEVFRRCGFSDLDKSGAIEKYHRDEDYREEADLDGDGKIIPAEAKFYVLEDQYGDNKLPRQYFLNAGDRKELEKIFDNLLKRTAIRMKPATEAGNYSSDYHYALESIVHKMVDAGLYDGAIDAACDPNEGWWGSELLRHISSSAIKEHRLTIALKAAHAMKPDHSGRPMDRTVSICEMIAQASRSDPLKSFADSLFRGVRKEAKACKEAFYVPVLQEEISLQMVAAGSPQKALTAAREIDDPKDRSETLIRIAAAMAKNGTPRDLVSSVFAEAIETSLAVKDASLRDSRLLDVVDYAVLRGFYVTAKKALSQVADWRDRLKAVWKVGNAMKKAGKSEAEIRKLLPEYGMPTPSYYY